MFSRKDSVIDAANYSAKFHYVSAVLALQAGECEQTQAGNLLTGIERGEISRWYILFKFWVTLAQIERVAGRTLGTRIE